MRVCVVVYVCTESPKCFGKKAISNKYVFSFFTKGVYSFRRINRNRELIQYCWRSHRESTLANIQLRLGNKKLSGNG